MTRLRSSPAKQIAISVPAPLSGRLDVLLVVADAADEPTTRSRLIAALIYEAVSRSAEDLAAALKRYRTARVRDVFIRGYDRHLFLRPFRRQGPRGDSTIERLSARAANDLPEISPDDRLRHTALYRLTPSIPRPLDSRLDELVERVDAAGERTTRMEIVAALILTAPSSTKDVGALLERYMRAPPVSARRSTRRESERPARRGRPRSTNSG
jgi:hypothetical protein